MNQLVFIGSFPLQNCFSVECSMKLGKIVFQISIFDLNDFRSGLKMFNPDFNTIFTFEVFPSAENRTSKNHQVEGLMVHSLNIFNY